MSRNILYVGGFELPDRNAAAQRVSAIGKLFESLGFNTFFYGIHHGDASEKYVQTSLNVFSKAYPKTILDWLKFLFSASEIKKIIKKEKIIFETIVAYDYPGIALLHLFYICKKSKIKLIADCTEWYVPKGNLLFVILKKFDTFFRMKIMHKKMDGIIVISPFLKSYYSKNSLNIIQIPPLVDKLDDKWITKSINRVTDKTIIVYAGSPGNGGKDRIDKVIDALSIVSDKLERPFLLKIIGIERDQYLKDFHKITIPRNLDNKIEFYGRLPHLNTLEIVKNAHYTIFLRDKNRVTEAGFPTKFVESISAGTPVLCNRMANIIEFMKNDTFGFILDDRSKKSLYNSLLSALNKPIDHIYTMKERCSNDNTFHFSEYESEFRRFINK